MYTGKQTSSLATSPGQGEDGDFVQLRILRERKRASEVTDADDVQDTSFTSLIPIAQRIGQAAPLFAAVDNGDLEKMKTLISSIGLPTIRGMLHPDTGQNIFLYALSKDQTAIASCFMDSNNLDLLTASTHSPGQQSRGQCNALHLLTIHNDLRLAKNLLDLIPTRLKRQALIKQETAVDIAGQRQRLFSCLHLAAHYGYSDFVSLYLDQGVDVNHLNGKEDTALLWAARWGHNSTVSLLLAKGGKSELKNDKGSTPLYWAVRYGHVETARQLLAKGKANPNVQRKAGLVAPLIVASAYGNVQLVSLLIQYGADVNMKIRGGEKAIHHAAMEGHLNVVNDLLSKGARIDDKEELGNTPLLLAAREGWADIVKSFIWRGADVTHKNNDGLGVWDFAVHSEHNALLQTLMKEIKHTSEQQKALFLAARAGNVDKIRLLLRLGIAPDTTDDMDSNSMLHHAAIEKKHEVIKNFSDAASINAKNANGMTPLMYACANGDARTISTLLTCKAKTDIKDKHGSSALHYAARSEYISAESAKELVQYSIQSHSWESLNERNKVGQNCLHVAGQHAKPQVMWEFRQVRLKDRDDDGRTPLHMAVRPGDPSALDMMLDIFEAKKRDADINAQTYDAGETVLHLAVQNGDTNGVSRLIRLGADLYVGDRRRQYSAVHMAVWCYREAQRQGQDTKPYLEVLSSILHSAEIWLCNQDNLPYSTDKRTSLLLTRRAFRVLVYEIPDCHGKSVLQLAFDCCAAEIISKFLTWDNITMYATSDQYLFDVTALTPVSNGSVPRCCGTNQTVPTTNKSSLGTSQSTAASGLELLIKGDNSTQHMAEVLDITPIRLIEHHYSFLVARTYTLLLIFHIVYMSLFTYIGLDLQLQLRDEASVINFYDPELVLLYVIVPLEPLLVLVFLLYTTISSCFGNHNSGDTVRLGCLRRIASTVKRSAYLLLNCAFSVLTVTWIIMFSVRYEFQDIVLATTICIGWLLTIAFTKGIKSIHYFYKMVQSMIIRDVLRFLIVYLFVLLAFGFAFHIMFQVSKEISDTYPSPGDTIFLMFDMMIGMGELFSDGFESGMEGVGRSPTYVKVFYVFYMVLTMVVLLNLLIAMMNDSYSTILQENSVTWRVETVNLGMHIEKTFPASRLLSRSDSDLQYGPMSDQNLDEDSGSGARWNVHASRHHVERMREESALKKATSKDFVSKRLDDIEQGASVMQKQLTQISERLDLLAGTMTMVAKRRSKLEKNELKE